MKNSVILIDGENFQFKVEEVIKKKGVKVRDLDRSTLKLHSLLSVVLKRFSDIKIFRIIYYSAKLHPYKESLKKSNQLIAQQRKLKRNLENQGVEFLLAGHVRMSTVSTNGKKKLLFREKGVDVQIAVDMLTFARKRSIDSVVLLSSDSDLQPAVQKVKESKKEIVYMGFKNNPNKGLIFTCDRSALITDTQVLRAFK